MGKYLKKFETTAAYNAAKPNLILPNVSLITETNGVAYNPSTPPTPSHDYVEIGGIKWATMNVGATGVTDAGLYFQWADTSGYTAEQVGSGEGKKYFDYDWTDYKYWTADTGSGSSGFTKYNTTSGPVTLEASDDAVAAAWGGSWRMPTMYEFSALGDAVDDAWTADYQGSGVSGIVLTDKTDSSKVLFFPAVGYASDGSVGGVGSECNYWSSSLYNASNKLHRAFHMMYLQTTGLWWTSDSSRCYGFPIRGILDE